MSIEKEETGKGITLRIDGSFSIYEAAANREALLDGLTANEEVTLDLGGVTDCDVAGIQLLCSAGKTAANMGKRLCITGVSPSVLTVMEEMGMPSLEALHPES